MDYYVDDELYEHAEALYGELEGSEGDEEEEEDEQEQEGDVEGEENQGDEEEEEEDEQEQEGDVEEEEEEGEENQGDEEEEYVPPTTRVSSNRLVPPVNHHMVDNNVVHISDDEEEDGGGGDGGGEATTSSAKEIKKESSTPGGSSGREGADGNDICCPICMEPWSSEGDHQISSLPCGHVYGLSCISKWIRQSKSSKCPQCGRRCIMKNITKLYVPRLAVADGEQEKKVLALQAENDFLRMQIASLTETIQQGKEEELYKQKVTCLENARRPSETITGTSCSQCQGQMPSGNNFAFNPAGQRFPCSISFQSEVLVDGARMFDIDFFGQMLILARRLSGMGGSHVLTKISLMCPYERENIFLPPSTKAVRDLHVSPSGELALFASLGKKLSILSMESNNIVLNYNLPVPAWSCSWDLKCSHHLYAGLQNGTTMLFDMRQTSGPLETLSGLTCNPVHTVHSLAHNSSLPNGVGGYKMLLSASSIGPCVWNIGQGVWNSGAAGERPFRLPDMDNQGVCISLAYSLFSDDIVASFRPKVQISNDTFGTQPSPSPSPAVPGQGVLGSHVHLKRVGGCYQKFATTPANVADIRMMKSAIINMKDCNPVFAYGDEVTRGLKVYDLPSLRVIQNLRTNQHPILDVKYKGTLDSGLLGCVTEDRLQLYSIKPY